jgi:RNA polymerase sigma-70 factor (sigma-E family)
MDRDDELAAFCAAQLSPLVRTLALYTGSASLAEDLAQEALTTAVRDWTRVRRATSPGAYVHRVAINLANGHFRRRKVAARALRRAAAGPAEPPAGPHPADVLALRAAVSALPRRRRAVVVLRYQAGLSLAEIADVLGITTGTVKSQLHDALATLRRTLDDAEEPRHVH